MDDNLNGIRSIEIKYGSVLFGMALIHLTDVGYSNVTDNVTAQLLNKPEEANIITKKLDIENRF